MIQQSMDHTLEKHFALYAEDTKSYIDYSLKVFSDRILSREAGLTQKSRILAVLLQNKDKVNFDKLIHVIDLPEITKACEILDAKRLKKQTELKLQKFPNSSKFIAIINEQTKLMDNVEKMSLSLNKIKMVKKWVRTLTKEKIEHKALMFPVDLWKKLADLTHLNPKKDFPQNCDWFLPYCFGGKVPEGTILYDYNNMTYMNFFELYEKYSFSYESIRTKLNPTDKIIPEDVANKMKNAIISKENLKTILWYWDELVDKSNIVEILNRLKTSSDDINLSYGKLVDIISKTENSDVFNHLVKLAEEKLKNYTINNDKKPVVIFGDRSPSMEIAIKTSSIIASILCCLCGANLHLFSDKDEFILIPPKTIESAIKFGREVKTEGTTSPASSLLPYYKQKQKVNTIIIVTDEEENTEVKNENNSQYFAELYKLYINEVGRAKIIFISFSDPNKDAEMVSKLKECLTYEEFVSLVKVFKFNVKDPDLNRMDIILRHLAEK